MYMVSEQHPIKVLPTYYTCDPLGHISHVGGLWLELPQANPVGCHLTMHLFFFSGQGSLCTVPSLSAFDQRHHLSWGDVSVDHNDNLSTLWVFLKCSKMDQLGREVYGRSNNNIIMFPSTVVLFVALRGCQPGVFFHTKSGESPTKPDFVHGIHTALDTLGLPQELFAGLSFRIGMAMAAAQAGIEDSTSIIL